MIARWSRTGSIGSLTLEVAAMIGSAVATGKVVLLPGLWADASKSSQPWTSFSIVVSVIIRIMVVIVSVAY